MLVVSPNILEEDFRYLASYFVRAIVRDWCKIKQTYIYFFYYYFGQKIIKIGHKVITVKSRKLVQTDTRCRWAIHIWIIWHTAFYLNRQHFFAKQYQGIVCHLSIMASVDRFFATFSFFHTGISCILFCFLFLPPSPFLIFIFCSLFLHVSGSDQCNRLG